MQEYSAFWKNYVNFRERTTVRGYWIPVLINVVITYALTFLGNYVGILSIIGGIFGLAIMIPGIAIVVRRLHDINKAGTWIFISLIPLVGAIILLVFSCKQSVEEGNRFGNVQV